MNRFGKKITAFLLAFVTAAAVMPAIPAKAEVSYSTIEMNTTITGPAERTESYYRFTMEESGRINVTLNISKDYSFWMMPVKLYEADGEIAGDCIAENDADVGTYVCAWDVMKGDYFLYVSGPRNYSLTLTPEYSGSTYDESADEQNYNENTAKKVDFNKTVKAALSMNETDGDFYKIKVGSKGILKVTANTKAKDAQLVVYKMGKTPQTFNLMSGKSINKVKLDSKGTYYVIVRKGKDTGNYNFKLNFKKKK